MNPFPNQLYLDTHKIHDKISLVSGTPETRSRNSEFKTLIWREARAIVILYHAKTIKFKWSPGLNTVLQQDSKYRKGGEWREGGLENSLRMHLH